MATGSGNRDRQREDRAYDNSQKAIAGIQSSEFEHFTNTYNLNLLKNLALGKDIKDIDELSAHRNLFNSAINSNRNYAGEGLISPNALQGSNSAQMGLIAQQIKDRQKQQAQGDLYNSVQDARQQATAGGQWGAGLEQNRQMGRANLYNNQYTTLLGKKPEPSFWEKLLFGGMEAASRTKWLAP